jgi:outer membrane lipoprotein-sorting protein
MNNWILVFTISVLTIVGKAQDFKPVEDKSTFQNALKNSSEKVKSITANFSQIKYLSFMEEEVKSSGKFYFIKPDKVRWEYTSPTSYFIVINGNQLITFMNGKKTVIDASKNKTFGEINKIMVGSINGEIANHPDFKSTLYESTSAYRLNLVPQSKALKEVMNEIIIWFDKGNMAVNQIKMLEASGDYSIISLADKNLNATISSDLFNP